jgi:hypothetical protein
MQMTWQKIALSIVATCFSFLIADAAVQIAYRQLKGFYTWNTVEHFRVRDITIRTNDTRYVTGKPNFSIENQRAEGIQWNVKLDEHGFRKGPYESSRSVPNIVFLGDSVPFGWGVKDDQTVASYLHQLLDKQDDGPHPIINAAIPSYSLDQAISRYEKEIHGQFPVRLIVLQIIDPVSQFCLLGADWSTEKNWSTYSRWGGRTKHIREDLLLFRYSSLFYFFKKAVFKVESESLDVADEDTFKQFESSIRSSLRRLQSVLEPSGIQALILSSNSPKASIAKHSKARRKATLLLHKELSLFASQHDNLSYLDMESQFAGLDESDLFIDDCCHLSPGGAQLQAAQLKHTIELVAPVGAP